MTTTCRSCAAPILWARTVKGARMPLDTTPHPTGQLAVRKGPAPGLYDVRVLGHNEAPQPDETRHNAHFVTCPNATSLRTPKATT